MVFREVDKYAKFTAASSDTTVHTVSPSRKLTVKDIVITNKETSTITVTLYDGPSSGGVVKGEFSVGAGSTEIFSFKSGIKFSAQVVAQVSSYSNGSSIWIGGYEE